MKITEIPSCLMGVTKLNLLVCFAASFVKYFGFLSLGLPATAGTFQSTLHHHGTSELSDLDLLQYYFETVDGFDRGETY